MLTTIEPVKGSLLISEPFMLDDHFKRSVVLISHQSEDGDIGCILNQPSNMLLKDIYPDCWDANFTVYIGGPVAMDMLNFIHRCPDKIEGGIEITNGIYWGGDFESTQQLINSYRIQEDEIRFFVGYSGWEAGQLQQELLKNSWLVTDAYHPDMIFDTTDKDIWKECIINMGQKYAHISNFPENPQWN